MDYTAIVVILFVNTIAFGAIIFLVSLMRNGFQATIAAYERLNQELRGDNKDLRDRLFQSKNLPPSGVDAKALFEQREQEQQIAKQRKQQSQIATPSGIGPVTKAVHSAIALEAEKLKQNSNFAQ